MTVQGGQTTEIDMTKTRPGRRLLPNGKTVAQQREADLAHAMNPTPGKYVGDMDAAEFEAYRLAKPDHPAVRLRLKLEGRA
jgi:hypothetical protein